MDLLKIGKICIEICLKKLKNMHLYAQMSKIMHLKNTYLKKS